MTALTDTELIAWLNRTSSGWLDLLHLHPQALDFPCTTRESKTVADLLQHIVAVELRYAERLTDLPETPYDLIPTTPVDAIFAVHDRAMHLLQPVLQRDDAFWNQFIEFTTRSAGEMRAPRRAIFVHLCMHSIRHYAQLATLLREHGVSAGWPMDYLFMQLG